MVNLVNVVSPKKTLNDDRVVRNFISGSVNIAWMSRKSNQEHSSIKLMERVAKNEVLSNFKELKKPALQTTSQGVLVHN